MNVAEKAWDKVRNKDAGDAEFARADPAFRAKLNYAVGVARQGGSTGIAGLEDFEEEVRRLTKNEKSEKSEPSGSNVDAALVDGSQQARSTDGINPADIGLQSADAEGEKSVKKTSRGSGQQDEPEKQTPEKALENAAAAGARVEASEAHSPSAPSAARPLAAEAPGNAPSPEERKAAEKSSKRSKASASKTSKAKAKKASK
ncbi:MAG TPA: hypothetical protein VN256_13145 [Pyrinomonadaceae bacterium]|nr:hypothetical protein [Pyrinomonadaceae bacterium]